MLDLDAGELSRVGERFRLFAVPLKATGTAGMPVRAVVKLE